ncbi:thiolase, C-terminal domain protein [Mycolicibacterium hassiacum DSM 44199]|uniref:Thiolase, C-terminal domain protein n=1 Tax=Mycolicibacterium hassiacum (strain DSM 44199 / CIP 105218 / JCM 12690 / 3849) TaxID=1122247 RepID=K5BCI6_MYCHD|nr:acetyl-CoA acetyltransferase [Mycolicibacterium hassiacum]EKF21592.1 thiolase, C-terminal domain protein [Mycolicibacterium hassiacum DSM 44199]MBX5487440.1 acetyl-CoA acetyltransferase [Mycolicibacterium hassiacum]MDA4085026.1 thiolase [Mycolicibacterium hassiacum DSM 44199]PZN20781.1 MAG: acetyl-CoA acetyltransferase [Mycolicibacterium hassiacum]
MAAHKVAIVGVGLSDCGRVPDKTATALMAQAARRALADSGLNKSDIDGLGAHGSLLAPIEVGEYLGLRPTWVDSTNVGGSSWEEMARHAAAAIAAGEIDVALLTYGSTARSDVKRRKRASAAAMPADGAMQYEAPYGVTLIAKYAMAARRHMIEYGTTIEQLAEIAVAAHEWAAMNENAFDRERITIEDVAAAPMLADPFTSRHVCLRTDGGGAVILANEEVARDCAKAPVWILGAASAASHVSMSEWADFTTSAAAVSGPKAFARAGVSPADIDVCQLYDSFTSTVLLTVEDLGFCAKGEGGPFVATGALRPGGSLPTNTDGGGLASCHPGMRGMFLMVEAVRQLRGECGPCQVDNAELACVHAMGGFFSHSATMILGRDR